MKYLLIVSLFFSSFALATNQQPVSTSNSKSEAEALAIAAQQQGQSQSQTANVQNDITVAGDTLNSDITNDVNNLVEGSTYHNDQILNQGPISTNIYQPRNFIGYQAPLGEIKVGDVSVTTSSCGFTVGYNNEKSQFGGNGGAVAGGCSFPIGGAKSALKTATDKLDYSLHVMKADEARTAALHEIEIVQIVETHEVEMARACSLLHKAGVTSDPSYVTICQKIGFTDDHHRPMEDNPSHARISDHH